MKEERSEPQWSSCILHPSSCIPSPPGHEVSAMHPARDTAMPPNDNPYLAEAAAIRFGEPDPAVVQSLAAAGDRGGLGHYIEQLQRARDTLAVRYAHAIPDEDALETLAELAPLVELGAGTGYWAWL